MVVIGGGLTGCEIAYELAQQGKRVSIVEMLNDILIVPGSCMANTSYLRDAFEYYHVDIYTSAKTKCIEKDGIVIETEDGFEKKIPAATVVTSIGYVQGTDFEESEHVHIIGDANKVSNLKNAIWQANDFVQSL